MKRYLYLVLVALIATAPLSLISCSSDDDEEGGGNNSTPSSSATLKINGVDWVASTNNPPVFSGHFDGGSSYGLIFTQFTRKETDIKHLVMAESFGLNITMKIGYSITKGMDLATSDYLEYASGNSEMDLSEGIWGENSYRYGRYSLKGAKGSAVVVDFKEKEFLTIKFTNFKVNTFLVDQTHTDNAHKVLTIDGTVTYKYDEYAW